MVCSPEKLAANRANSKKSTGPKTPEGKAISRQNGLKHGLTGEGVVIPDEDVAAVAERFEAFEADLKPANDVARFLAGRAAVLSVRLDRAAREEASRLRRAMLGADDAEVDARADEIGRLTAGFAEHSVESVRKLRRTDEGIDWLIESWRVAKADLLNIHGSRFEPTTALRLQGRPPEHDSVSRIMTLTAAMRGYFDRLEPTDWPDLLPTDRRAAAKAELVATIDREIAGLEAARAGLDRERMAEARAGADARAIFDGSKDATLARKYEAAAERSFFRTLDRIEEINATVEQPAEVEATPETGGPCDEVASCLPAEAASVNRLEGSDEWERRRVRNPENRAVSTEPSLTRTENPALQELPRSA